MVKCENNFKKEKKIEVSENIHRYEENIKKCSN